MSVIITQAPAANVLTSTTGGTFQSFVGGNCILNAPGGSRLNGQRFNVKASGFITFAAGTYTSAVTAIIYGAAAIGATVTSTAALFTATATGVVTSAVVSSQPVSIVLDLEGDSTSGLLQGSGSALVNNAVVANVAIGNAPTSVNFATEPPVQFAAAFKAVSAVASVTLSQFTLEA